MAQATPSSGSTHVSTQGTTGDGEQLGSRVLQERDCKIEIKDIFIPCARPPAAFA